MKKLLPLLILSLFLASCVAPRGKNRGVDQIAVSDVGQSDCVAGDCENGVGKLIFSSGASYAGRLFLLLFNDPLFKSNRLIIQNIDSPIVSASNIRAIWRHID